MKRLRFNVGRTLATKSEPPARWNTRFLLRCFAWWVMVVGLLAGGSLPVRGEAYTIYSWSNFAGHPGSVGSADGMGACAQFNAPYGVAVDNAGNLFVADTGNSTIRKVSPVGTNWVVTTLGESPLDTGYEPSLSKPLGVAVDRAGNVIVADYGNSTIRMIGPGFVNVDEKFFPFSTLAGAYRICGNADGPGSAARFCGPASVAMDSAGNVYIGDNYNNAIRVVSPVGTNWVVTTL